MKIAYDKGVELHPNDLAYTQATYAQLGSFMNSFTEAIHLYKVAYRQQSECSQEYQEAGRRARLYVSHFIQVVNMCILRGELKPTEREYYGLKADETRLPSLTGDQEVVDWGQRIIDGEFNRTSEGKTPIMNPTIAMVRVHYEAFFAAYTRQRTLQRNTARTQAKLLELRETADQIILSIWNEVEARFSHEQPEVARSHAMEYGVKYVYRRGELQYGAPEDPGLISEGQALLFREFARRQGDDPDGDSSPDTH